MRVRVHKVPLVLLFSVSTIFVFWFFGVLLPETAPLPPDAADLRIFKTARPQPESQSRLFCLVLTTPWQVNIRARAVYDSWGKNCDKIIFLSSQPGDGSLPVVSCNCTEYYDFLWGKVRIGWLYVHENFNVDVGTRFDWFLKADDDTYISVRKLKQLLSKFDPEKVQAIGRKNKHVNLTFLSGGAGYVLSRAALNVFYDGLINHVEWCPQKRNFSEDILVSYCLGNLKVPLVGVNENGRTLLNIDHPNFENAANIADLVPEDTISFHHLLPKYMKPLEEILH